MAKIVQPQAPGKKANLMHESSMEPDVDFVPDMPYINSSDLESSLLISESLSATLETSPLLFKIKKKKVSDLSEGTKTETQTKVLKNSRNIKKEICKSCYARSDRRIY